MKKIKFDLRFLYLFIPMLLLELIFHLVQFKSLEFFTVLRIFLFVSFLSFFISLITTRFSSRKVYFIVGLIVMISMTRDLSSCRRSSVFYRSCC